MKGLYEWGVNKVYVQIKGIKEWNPRFERYIKGTAPEVYKVVEGSFKSITYGEKVFPTSTGKDEVKEEMSITLVNDDGEEIVVQSCWTGLSRGLINTLCSLGEVGKINISLWLSNNWYATAYVRSWGKLLGWLMDMEEQNKYIEKVELPTGKTQNFYHKLEAELKERSLKLKSMSIERELGIDVDQPTNEAKPLPEDFSEMPF